MTTPAEDFAAVIHRLETGEPPPEPEHEEPPGPRAPRPDRSQGHGSSPPRAETWLDVRYEALEHSPGPAGTTDWSTWQHLI
jgi:hypothetical protein